MSKISIGNTGKRQWANGGNKKLDDAPRNVQSEGTSSFSTPIMDEQGSPIGFTSEIKVFYMLLVFEICHCKNRKGSIIQHTK